MKYLFFIVYTTGNKQFKVMSPIINFKISKGCKMQIILYTLAFNLYLFDIQMNNKNKEHRQRAQSNKPPPFQNNWSINQQIPRYDALEDSHADYYFLNKSVRRHLSTLKRSINLQGSHVQKKKIRNLIVGKIHDYNKAKWNKTLLVSYNFNHLQSDASLKPSDSERSEDSFEFQNQLNKTKKKSHKQAKLYLNNLKTINMAINRYEISKYLELPKILQSKQEEYKVEDGIQKLENQIVASQRQQHKKFMQFIQQRKKIFEKPNPINKINLFQPTRKAESQY